MRDATLGEILATSHLAQHQPHPRSRSTSVSRDAKSFTLTSYNPTPTITLYRFGRSFSNRISTNASADLSLSVPAFIPKASTNPSRLSPHLESAPSRGTSALRRNIRYQRPPVGLRHIAPVNAYATTFSEVDLKCTGNRRANVAPPTQEARPPVQWNSLTNH